MRAHREYNEKACGLTAPWVSSKVYYLPLTIMSLFPIILNVDCKNIGQMTHFFT